jgi:hypothetical protein
MPQIIAREFTVTSAMEIDTGSNAESVTAAGVIGLLQHLLAESTSARAQPGYTAELSIRVAADGQRVHFGGRAVVRWIASERWVAMEAVDTPL